VESSIEALAAFVRARNAEICGHCGHGLLAARASGDAQQLELACRGAWRAVPGVCPVPPPP
jgi:hypothetical protein